MNKTSFVYGVVVAMAVFCWGTIPAQSQSVYFVRSGATGLGNGSDWNNAYTNLPATLQRGATYYVAGGSYPGFTFNTAQSGTNLITVKKATITDQGTNVGWNDSFGTNQAVFTPIVISRGYFVMNGQYRNEANWFSGVEYGFCVTNAGWGSQVTINNGATPCPNVTIEYVWVANVIGQISTNAGTPSNGIDCRNYTSSSLLNSNYVFSHVYSEGANQPFWVGDCAMPTIEYCATRATCGNSYYHCETVNLFYSVDGGGIIRYNWFRDHCNGASGYPAGGSTAVVSIAYTGEKGGYTDIYGNIFDGWGGYGIECDWPDAYANVHVYNNTFISRPGDVNYGQVSFGSAGYGTGNVCTNNLAYSPASVCSFGGSDCTFGYNASDTTSAFVNYTNRNYVLVRDTAKAGTVLPSPYNVDIVGNIRGTGSVWDLGAYQYVSSSTNPPVISSVGSSSINSSGAVIAWTTDKLASSVVNYGTNTTYGSTATNSSLVLAHSVTLSSLTPSTLYHYQVSSTDAAGHTSVSGDFTFTTATLSLLPPTGLHVVSL